MSALPFTLQPSAAIALSSATAKTVLRVDAPANHRVKLLGFGVAFDGNSATAVPVLVELLRVTDAGTMTSLTPRKTDDSLAETIQSTAAHTATVEPTPSDILKSQLVHPQRSYEYTVPFTAPVLIGGGDRLALRCTAPAGVNVLPWMMLEE